jgi:hypothetical protein
MFTGLRTAKKALELAKAHAEALETLHARLEKLESEHKRLRGRFYQARADLIEGSENVSGTSREARKAAAFAKFGIRAGRPVDLEG